ncbi:hypothetical protein NFX39_01150 [Fructobacillus sp. W13]|uniref:Protein CR006 P-loop domain-containing protein n=1 Tax=Fructobacillus apis TaxID=2935017 RepID=A0ABT0ZNX9_9LACO|nr:hypothetical protein [Fructobacillus apis]MCO0831701.1 hypothetical protein [Fructobacillus apis]
MIDVIDLPSDRFESEQISGLRKKNYIFGKNGSGKSSLTKLLRKQKNEE